MTIGYPRCVPGLPKLKEIRERVGLTQVELAAKLGVKQTAVSRWETNRGFPEIPLLVRLPAVLGVTLEELIDGVDAEYDQWRKDKGTALPMNDAADPASRLSQRALRDATEDGRRSSCGLRLQRRDLGVGDAVLRRGFRRRA